MTYQAMTVSRWMEQVHQHKDKLRDLVASWHPSARFPRALQDESVLLTDGSAVAVPFAMEITAPNAERACQEIRQQIRKEEQDDPVERFDKAVTSADVGEIMSLLNSAWFGVPESTSCWQIRGFAEAVDLLDDPPEEEAAS